MSSGSDLIGDTAQLGHCVSTLDGVLEDESNGPERTYRERPRRSMSVRDLYDCSATSDKYKYFDHQERLLNSSPCDNFSMSEQSNRLEKLQSRLGNARTVCDAQDTISRHHKYLGAVKAKNENLKTSSKPMALTNALQQAIKLGHEAVSKRCEKIDVLVDSEGIEIDRPAHNVGELVTRGVTHIPLRRELRATKSADEFTSGGPIPPERRSRRSTSALGLCPPPMPPNRRALGPIGLEVNRSVSCSRALRFDSLGSSSHHSFQSWCSGVSSLGMDSYSERSESTFASLSRTCSQKSRFLPSASVDTVLRSDHQKRSDEMPPRRPSRRQTSDAIPRRPTRFRSPSPPR